MLYLLWAIVVLDGEWSVLLYFGGCWGLWMSLVEVLDKLWGEEISFGDPLVV